MRHGPLRKLRDKGSADIGGRHACVSIEVKRGHLNGQEKGSIHAVCDDNGTRKMEGHQ